MLASGRTFAACVTAVLGLALAAPGASAYQVTVEVYGSGSVTELTNSNLLPTFCRPDAPTPTGVLGKTCTGGTPESGFGWGWTVKLQASPSVGYRFDGWTNGPNGKFNCDDPTSTICQFGTFDNGKVSARFVDDTPPDTEITTAPAGTTGTSATFGYRSVRPRAEAGRRFECRFDGVGEWVACGDRTADNVNLETDSYSSASKTFDGLAGGNRRFEVRAVDISGNADPTPAVHDWTVDATPPTTSFSAGPAEGSLSNLRSGSFTLASSDASGTAFQCSLDAAAYTSCSSVFSYFSLADGPHTFSARSRDAYGNWGPIVTRRWSIDATAPTVTVSQIPTLTNSTSATFTLGSTDPTATFECRAKGEIFFSACTSPVQLSGLLEGLRSLEVRARDLAGNIGPVVTRSWTVDLTGPPTQIVDGPAEGTTTAERGATFRFASAEAGVAFECRLDDAPFGACSDDGGQHVVGGLADGPHAFEVRAVDAAGNPDPTPSRRTWTVDTTPAQTTPTTSSGDTASAQTTPTTSSGDTASAQTTPAAPPSDTTRPTVVMGGRAVPLPTLLAKGLPVPVTSSEAGRAVTRLMLSRVVAKRLKLSLVLARRATNVAAGQVVKVVLRPSRVAARKLRRLRSVTLTIQTTVTDAAGNLSAVRSRTLTIKR